MWSPTTRPKYERNDMRYASDLTAEELVLIEPHLAPANKLGRPRKWGWAPILNGLFYLLRTGCQWRQLPSDFPPWQTVYGWFARWRDDGTLERINHALVMRDRERVGREASPTAGIIDSQSVKTTESGGPRGYDAGKKVKGRKRHILTDTEGHLLAAIVHTADIQDRDGAPLLMSTLFGLFPWLQKIFADAGYAGEKAERAIATFGSWVLEIVKRPADAQGFQVLPRRWVVERTFAWLCRNRRLAKDFETHTDSAKAYLYAASIMLLTRRLARDT